MNTERSQLMSVYLNLTRRQREVVYWVQQGLSNPEVGEQLCIAPSVVAGHLTNIYEQLSAINSHAPGFRVNRYLLVRLFAGSTQRWPVSERDLALPLGFLAAGIRAVHLPPTA